MCTAVSDRFWARGVRFMSYKLTFQSAGLRIVRNYDIPNIWIMVHEGKHSASINVMIKFCDSTIDLEQQGPEPYLR